MPTDGQRAGSRSSDTFTDGAGNVYIDGQQVPVLRAVGFLHRHPCPLYAVAAVAVGKPFGCDCGGTVLMGWRSWWPFPDEEGESLVIDMGGDDDR